MVLNRKYYVYRFIDTHGKNLYIGQTNCLSRRIKQHLTFESGKFDSKSVQNIQRIEYITLPDRISARCHEVYFINKYMPSGNISDKFTNVVFEENPYYEKKWKTYRVLQKPVVEYTPLQRKCALLIPYVLFAMIFVWMIL